MASASTSTSGADAATAYYTSLSFTEVLEDLSIRFIVNLPQEELSSIERIGFQVEQAHWFYEDFLRPLNPSLPSYPLRRFSSLLLRTASQTVPLIEQFITGSASKGTDELESAFDEFMRYKTRVPVCGAAIVNRTWDKVLLVKGWKSSASWGFPKGKINQSESPVNCAIREVWEETGFDCTGLVSEAPKDSLEVNMREQRVRLFFVKGVDEETVFEAKARKEISKIAWFPLNELPTWKTAKAAGNGDTRKFYLVSPFVGKLKQWVKEEKEREKRAGGSGKAASQSIPTAPAAMREAQHGFEGVPSGPSAERKKASSQQPASQAAVPAFPDTSSLWQLLGVEAPTSPAVKSTHASYASAAGAPSTSAAPEDPSQALLRTLMGDGEAANAAPPGSNLQDVLSRSVGANLIHEQGDERGKELLNLVNAAPARKEDRLLGLINGGGATHSAPAPPPAKEEVLLGFLNGSAPPRQAQPPPDQASQLLSILGGTPSQPSAPQQSHTARTDSPLPAPRAKQAADLRGMINLASETGRVDAVDEEERRKQLQREMVLRNMLALEARSQGAGQQSLSPPEQHRPPPQAAPTQASLLDVLNGVSPSQTSGVPFGQHASPPQQPPPPPSGPASLLSLINGPSAPAPGSHFNGAWPGPPPPHAPPPRTHEEKLLSLLGPPSAPPQGQSWPGQQQGFAPPPQHLWGAPQGAQPSPQDAAALEGLLRGMALR